MVKKHELYTFILKVRHHNILMNFAVGLNQSKRANKINDIHAYRISFVRYVYRNDKPKKGKKHEI